MIPKFRFWDKQELNFVAYLNNIVLKYDGTIEGIEYEMTGEGNVYNDISYFEVMQSTGLKDKNSVEIFEGGVVRLTSDYGVDYVGLIIYKDGGYCAIDGTEENYSTRRYQLHKGDCELEVIGNQFQHPHLLEE